ncbi:MAG: glycosyltransferase family 39 protein [Anaerolineae bacterium]|nr:glycosyltransferase family 39 protein [Anaerolineae bacterium]
MNNSFRKPYRYPALLLITVVLLLAAGLRIYQMGDQSLSRDEGVSAQSAVRTVAENVEAAKGNLYPPGYEIILAGWRVLVGRSELSLRLFSVLGGVLTVALIYRLGRRFFSPLTGLLAAIAVAINPLQVYIGQDATRGAMLGLISTASLLLTRHILTHLGERQKTLSGSHPTVILIGSCIVINTVGLYTAPLLFLLLILAETAVFLLWLFRQPHKQRAIWIWSGMQLATLLLFAPWAPVLAGCVADLQVVAVPMWLQVVAYGFTLPIDRAQDGLVPLVLLATIGVFPPIKSLKEADRLSFSKSIGLIVVWLLASLMLSFWEGGNAALFLSANLALMILTARGVWMGFELAKPIPAIGRNSNKIISTVVLLLMALSLLPIFNALQHLYVDPNYARDDYRGIAARIRAEVGPQAAIILAAPDQYDVFTYYYPDGDVVVVRANDDINGKISPLIEHYRRVYAVLGNVDDRDSEPTIETVLGAKAVVANLDYFGATQLVSYAVTGPAAAEPATLSNASFGESIVLDGFTLSASTLAPGEGLGVTLFWHAQAPLGERYKVFVHLDGPGGAPTSQHDGEPADWTAPTDSWVPGETIIDQHKLLMPDAPSGTYQIMIGIYDQSGTRLPVSINGDPVGDRLFLSDILTP